MEVIIPYLLNHLYKSTYLTARHLPLLLSLLLLLIVLLLLLLPLLLLVVVLLLLPTLIAE